MDEPMDLDQGENIVPHAMSFSPPAPSIGKRPNLNLSETQRTTLKEVANQKSGMWRILLGSPLEEKEQRYLIGDALRVLALTLQGFKLKGIEVVDPWSAEKLAPYANEETFENMKRAFRKGVEDGDWEDLVAVAELVTQPTSAGNVETEEDQAIRLHKGFNADFKGNAVQSFLKGLDAYAAIYNTEKYYGRCIALLQSSGTGKSRLVHQLGKEVPTLSVCFRKDRLPMSGWPPCDQPAYDFFVQNNFKQYRGDELAAAFIGALVSVIAEKLDPRIASASSTIALMEDWALPTPTDYHSSPRLNAFEKVKQVAETLLETHREDFMLRRASLSTGSNDHIVYVDYLYAELCKPHIHKLSNIIRSKYKRFVIAFDECSMLNSLPLGKNPRRDNAHGNNMSLISLQRVIKACDVSSADGVTIWFVLLDTNSSVFDLAPSGERTPSARLIGDSSMLPIWPYLGFNQMIPKTPRTLETAAQALSMRHLKVYGRPYWSGIADAYVLSAAREKLFCGNFDSKNENNVLAAFSVRVGLEIGADEATDHLAKEAVARHMRILRGVVHGLVITTSPPEPVLALAAADCLNTNCDVYRQALRTLLECLVLRGLVFERGKKGELCSRILLARARDKATVFPLTGPRLPYLDLNDGGAAVRPVQLSWFLQTLLGKQLGVSDEQLCGRLLEEASTIWINFTHFVQLEASVDSVSSNFLFEAWSSGAAFQCAPLQPVIDGFVVGYKGDIKGKFDVKNLVIIPWQTKARSDAADGELVGALTTLPIVDGDMPWRKPGRLVILMDLGASAQFQSGGHVSLTYGSAVPPTKKRGRWGGYSKHEPERYCLNIRGHQSSTYPILDQLDLQFMQLFQHILSCTDPKFAEFLEQMDDDMAWQGKTTEGL